MNTQIQNTGTFIRCERDIINPALISPFSAGEIIARSDQVKVNGCNVTPLSFRPFGNLSIEGDVQAALPAVLAWINNEAMLVGSGWSWQDAVSETLLRGDSVNIERLPAGVILNKANT